jgi:hypothetical protein
MMNEENSPRKNPIKVVNVAKRAFYQSSEQAEDAAEAEVEGEEDEDETERAGGVYVPPRIAAVHYDDTATNKRKKREDREARKLRDSELYR